MTFAPAFPPQDTATFTPSFGDDAFEPAFPDASGVGAGFGAFDMQATPTTAATNADQTAWDPLLSRPLPMHSTVRAGRSAAATATTAATRPARVEPVVLSG